MNQDGLYKLRDNLFYDKNQTKLTNTGCTPNTFRFAEKVISIKYNENLICPFCLNIEIFGHFIKKRKNIFECPHCKNQMLKKTLDKIRKMNMSEFAKWVDDYSLSGFFSKINFESWNQKLYNLGLSYDFWEEYKRLKEELTTQETIGRNVK